jgi:ABC-type phosphate/phosphonate transport system substrate-binding protein
MNSASNLSMRLIDRYNRETCMEVFMQKRYVAIASLIILVMLLGSDFCYGEEKIIRIAFSNSTISDANLKDAKLAMEIWSKSLAAKMGFEYRTEVKFFKDLATLHGAVKSGEVDFVQFDSFDYVRWPHRNIVEPILVGDKNGTPLEKFYIIVHKESGIRSLAMLKNRKIIIERGNKAGIPLIWFDTALLREGLPLARRFCSSVHLEDNPSRSVLPVYFRQADACVVTDRAYNTMSELNPGFSSKLAILLESPAFIIGFFCARKGTDEYMRQSFIESGLSLEKEVEGRQILTLFRLDRVSLYKSGYISTTEKLSREYETLMRKK